MAGWRVSISLKWERGVKGGKGGKGGGGERGAANTSLFFPLSPIAESCMLASCKLESFILACPLRVYMRYACLPDSVPSLPASSLFRPNLACRGF